MLPAACTRPPTFPRRVSDAGELAGGVAGQGGRARSVGERGEVAVDPPLVAGDGAVAVFLCRDSPVGVVDRRDTRAAGVLHAGDPAERVARDRGSDDSERVALGREESPIVEGHRGSLAALVGERGHVAVRVEAEADAAAERVDTGDRPVCGVVGEGGGLPERVADRHQVAVVVVVQVGGVAQRIGDPRELLDGIVSETRRLAGGIRHRRQRERVVVAVDTGLVGQGDCGQPPVRVEAEDVVWPRGSVAEARFKPADRR